MGKRVRRLLTFTLAVILTLGLAGYIGISLFIYVFVAGTNNGCSQWGYSPADYMVAGMETPESIAPYLMPNYEDVSFSSRLDGLLIRAWYVPAMQDPAAAPTVILVHGLASCRRSTSVLFAAGMLHRAGFSTLILDLREHGDSQVVDGRMSGGTDEYRDVLGAWDWLVTEKMVPPERIGLFGSSLGAATAMIAFGEEPRIAAVWEDSGYADVNVTIRDELSRLGAPTIFAATARLLGNLIDRVDIGSRSPLAAIATAGDRPVFITHGTADTRLSVQYAYDLMAGAEAAGATHIQSWIVEGSSHVNAMFDHPVEYEQRLVAFFRAAIGAASPS
jgi:dipeptidyl aminopeptidase/acylaminoacyl peptidase